MDRSYSQEVAARVTNPAVRQFLLVEFEEVLRRRGDAVEPILNKVGPWLAYPELRNIVGQPSSAFDFREVLDHGRILLVRIPQGALGEDASNLLGALIVAKVQLAAQSRVDLLAERRRRFYLYVDEFQNFATSSFAKILTEARGFGLGLICANQYPEQLSRDLQLAVGRNAATLVQCVLRKGRHELQVVRQEDASEKHPEAFTVQPAPPLDAGDPERAALVRLRSRERYGARIEPALPSLSTTSHPPARLEPVVAGSAPNGHQAGAPWGRDIEEE